MTRGELPFYEPGLEPLLRAGLASGRLSFSTSYADAAAFGDVHFVCVGTPQREASYAAADLSQVDGCIGTLGPLLDRPCLVIGKSTVPVGTAETLAARLAQIAPAGTACELRGIRSSCARGMPSRTPCGRTGSSRVSVPPAPKPSCCGGVRGPDRGGLPFSSPTWPPRNW